MSNLPHRLLDRVKFQQKFVSPEAVVLLQGIDLLPPKGGDSV